MEGWIKLHRKLKENPIYSNSRAVHCWVECLLRASHKRKRFYLGRQKVYLEPGQFCMGREEFGKRLDMSGSTAWYWLLEFKHNRMIDIKTSNKGTVITVINWNKYQRVDSTVDSRKTAYEQQMNTNKNDKKEKNIITSTSTSNRSKTKKGSLKQKKKKTSSYGNERVSYVLDLFEKEWGFPPTDKQPRRVAWNIAQKTASYIKSRGGDPNEANFKKTIKHLFERVLSEDWSDRVQTLDVIKRKMPIYLRKPRGGEND